MYYFLLIIQVSNNGYEYDLWFLSRILSIKSATWSSCDSSTMQISFKVVEIGPQKSLNDDTTWSNLGFAKPKTIEWLCNNRWTWTSWISTSAGIFPNTPLCFYMHYWRFFSFEFCSMSIRILNTLLIKFFYSNIIVTECDAVALAM